VVVGGGLAGITAALRCADAGHRVVLLEAKPRLGGLTYSFRRGELMVDNGQHVFLRCCTAYRELLARLDVTDRVSLQPRLDIPVRRPDGNSARLRRSGWPAPLHLGGALLRYRLLTPAQRIRFVRAALALKRLDRNDPAVDDRTFADWLAAHRQDQPTVDALWELVSVATLNARAAATSLRLAAMVFQVGLLTEAGAADIGWSAVPLQELHGDAAVRALTAAGAEVTTGVPVDRIDAIEAGWRVAAGGREYRGHDVIVAVPPAAAETLLPAGAIAAAPGWAARLGTAPIINVHVVLDRVVLREPFVAGIGTAIQWVFDRTAPSGLAAGQYLAVSVSAAEDFIDQPVAALRAALMPQLEALLPELRGASITDFFVSRERQATFRPAPGSARLRASTQTGAPGLFLAGAWTDTGWPATMEGAVRSGNAAAAAVLARPVRTGVVV
jgi:squalene-associated FAD-dependent desaturase